jgi:hypothetical protein
MISWADRVKEVLHTVKKERNILHRIKGKAYWIGHILRRNWLLNHVTEVKMDRRTKVKVRREGRCKQILDDLQEKRGYCNLKEEVLDCIRWKTWFWWGHGTASPSFTDNKGMTDSVPHTKWIIQYNVDVMLYYVMLSSGMLCCVTLYIMLYYAVLCCMLMMMMINNGFETLRSRCTYAFMLCYIMLCCALLLCCITSHSIMLCCTLRYNVLLICIISTNLNFAGLI